MCQAWYRAVFSIWVACIPSLVVGLPAVLRNHQIMMVLIALSPAFAAVSTGLKDDSQNEFRPQLVDPANGDFRPLPGGNLFAVQALSIPDFSWTDAPTQPAVPAGALSNAVPFDRAGNPRVLAGPPGAYAAAESAP